MNERERTRNFSIVAHIDHGKSTLADRLMVLTGAVSEREMREQFLDNMDLERERGITIKSQTVRLEYAADDGETYTLNLLDTPGHVDFSYEVSRSLAACEGALLVVDATQGVEAQTLANAYLAVESDLALIPVVNKIDLPSAEPERVLAEVAEGIGIEVDQAVQVSAKTGIGLKDLVETIIREIPPPTGDPDVPLKALIFDSWYDPYRGVVALVRVFEGTLKVRSKVEFMGTTLKSQVEELGVFAPRPKPVQELQAGQVGYLITGIKDIREIRVGDTVTTQEDPAQVSIPGFIQMKPMVFSGIYPVNSEEFSLLREAFEKLALNDPSFTWEPETSDALGFGFRCGFLGLLHMEIVQERLDREYGMECITTAPNVVYKVVQKDGEESYIESPKDLPDGQYLEHVEEPMVAATVHVPGEHLGAVLKLCTERRGTQTNMHYMSTNRVQVTYRLPLAEIVFDFFDRLKSTTRGYASLDYEVVGYEESPLVRLDVMINGKIVDALSVIVHRDRAYHRGKALVAKMRAIIPRQMYEVAIQAAIGNRVIARESVRAYRKNVTAKCYGGDISRKRKLLERQKEGKKRMKQVGNVELPQEAFLAILKVDE
ncbi:MAG: elongation factor 4 [Myxococcales bacterium]|nr:elongation factor 4 [Myxococcales bacterium]